MSLPHGGDHDLSPSQTFHARSPGYGGVVAPLRDEQKKKDKAMSDLSTLSEQRAPTLNPHSLSQRFYNTAWRWHFYAGLYVIPFLLMLAITGLIMLYGNIIETPYGAKVFVGTSGPQTSLSEQADAAVKAIPHGTLKKYIAPREPGRAALFLVDVGPLEHVVTIDPHTNAVISDVIEDDTLYYWAHRVHNYFFMGAFGEHLIEIAAGFGIVLIITGLYLWWPRDGETLVQGLVPNLKHSGRRFWKELHVTVGFYLSLFLLFFLLSGMAWTSVWGGQFVQAWSTFPAAKYDAVPLSDKTQAAVLNHGPLKDVPWALEQTPMPTSGSDAGMVGIKNMVGMENMAGMNHGTPSQATTIPPIGLDQVVIFARSLGFHDQFRVTVPDGPEGVYTLSADSMDGDSQHPTEDRTVHLDQYTGNILADITYADYSFLGKVMAVGIALHQGDLGVLDTLANVLFCVSVVFLCVSGVVMWWLRRPAGAKRLMAPPRVPSTPLWKSAALLMVAVSVAFPLVGATLIVVLALDILIVSRIPALRRLLS